MNITSYSDYIKEKVSEADGNSRIDNKPVQESLQEK
jgi:hypothetical protein